MLWEEVLFSTEYHEKIGAFHVKQIECTFYLKYLTYSCNSVQWGVAQ